MELKGQALFLVSPKIHPPKKFFEPQKIFFIARIFAKKIFSFFKQKNRQKLRSVGWYRPTDEPADQTFFEPQKKLIIRLPAPTSHKNTLENLKIFIRSWI